MSELSNPAGNRGDGLVGPPSTGLVPRVAAPAVAGAEAGADPGIGDPEVVTRFGWLEGGLAILDSEGIVQEANQALADWLESARTDLAGASFWARLKGRCPGQDRAIDLIREGAVPFRELELRWSRQDGLGAGALRLEVAAHSGGLVARLGSILPPPADLAEGAPSDYPPCESVQRQLWTRLARAEAQLKLLSEQWPGVIFSQRADFSFRFISPRIEELTGIPAAEWGRRPDLFWQIVHESDAGELRELLAGARARREPIACTYRLRHARTGRIVYVLEHRRLNLSPGGLVLGHEGVWLDVTRQTLAERRLSSATWKETLSVLTMSLVHDFGNVMAGIHALVESSLEQAGTNDEVAESLNLVKQNSSQASQLVHQIIDLHQGRTGECYYHDLNELASNLAGLIRKVIPRRMQFALERCARALPVHLDAVELRQIVISLVINAVEAMRPDGRLVLRTDDCAGPPGAGRQWGAMARWPAARLSIRDDGAGIAPEHLPRIFEPFFSTKPGQKGTGLGLYNARVFVERHQGLIAVETAPRAGAVFSLLFPEADFAEGAMPGPAGAGVEERRARP